MGSSHTECTIEDKAQITWNSQLVNKPLNQRKQYTQTFDQSSQQHVTKGLICVCIYVCTNVYIDHWCIA